MTVVMGRDLLVCRGSAAGGTKELPLVLQVT